MSNIPQDDVRYLQQTRGLVDEVHALRSLNQSLTETNGLLKQQYDELAARHADMLKRFTTEVTDLKLTHERELHEATTAKDVAVRKEAAIGETLLATAKLITEALRARKGDETPRLVEPEQPARVEVVEEIPSAVIDLKQPSWRRDLDSNILYGPR